MYLSELVLLVLRLEHGQTDGRVFDNEVGARLTMIVGAGLPFQGSLDPYGCALAQHASVGFRQSRVIFEDGRPHGVVVHPLLRVFVHVASGGGDSDEQVWGAVAGLFALGVCCQACER